MQLIFDVEGMGCGACAARIERVLNGFPGIITVSVDLDVATLCVECDKTLASEKEIIDRIDELGYTLSKKG